MVKTVNPPAFQERNPLFNRNNGTTEFAVMAFFAAVFVYYAWNYIIGGLALCGLWYLYSQSNNNNRRPPRCR